MGLVLVLALELDSLWSLLLRVNILAISGKLNINVLKKLATKLKKVRLVVNEACTVLAKNS